MGRRDHSGYRRHSMAFTLPAIVFADIDGIPLHTDDSYRRLPSLLAALAAERIRFVFCSRRTRAEVEAFRQAIGIFHPFVCENGGVAFVPGGYFGSAIVN